VLPSRGWIGKLCLLLIFVLAGFQASAQHDVPVLRLLVLAPDSRPIQPAKQSGVEVAAVAALSTPAARRMAASFIGRPIDDALLADIRNRLTEYCASVGRPFVDIAIPTQDVGGGVLRVNVIEKRRGRVRVDGNRWFDDQQYIDAIRTRAGDPIDTDALAADTNWLNRNEHRHATIAVEPTDDPSVYDLEVGVKDSRPLDVTLAADNTGTTATGLYRTGVAVDWSNAFWRGDDLNYSFLTSPDQFRLFENTLSYTTYLPWRDWVTVSAVDAIAREETTGQPNDSPMQGKTVDVSFRYSISMPGSADFVEHLDLGYDFKTTNNNVLSGGTVVFPTTSALDQFVLAYNVRRNDPHGFTGVTAMFVGSPGNLTANNTQSALASQQPGASPSYVYGRLSIDRLTNLPFNSVWSTALTAQVSSANLLPSEQLVFGGIRSIRGFMELGATRDEGVIIQNELRFSPQKIGLFRTETDSGLLVPFVFVDFGAGRNHLDLGGMQRSWLEMVSVGPGLTWQFARNAALRLNWGFPLVRNGHTGPLLGPQFGTQITF
jgi:hemolysin activation/secretion protein